MLTGYFVPYVASDRKRRRLLQPSSYAWSKLFQLNLSVGLTPDLRVGGFWSGGIQDAYPDYEVCKFSVDSSMCATQSLIQYSGLSLAEVLVGETVGPFPIDMSLSHVAVFPALDQRATLIIPCQEIFRFYYGTSAKLAVKFVDGTFLTQRWKLINAKDTLDPDDNGLAVLRLGLWADNEDRVTLARVRFDATALEQAEQLIPSAIVNSARQQFPVIIRLPFRGETTLAVRGRWISIKGRRAFFAYLIDACSGPQPFLRLAWYRQTPPNKAGKPPTGDTKPAFAGSFRHVGIRDTGEPYEIDQGDDPAAEDLALKLVSKLNPDRLKTQFEDEPLDYDEIRYHRASVYTDVPLAGSRLSVGTGRRGSTHRAVSPTTIPDREMSDRLTNFQNAIALLPTLDPNVRVLGYDVYDIAKPIQDGDPYSKRPWAYMDSHKGKVPRRAAVATVAVASKLFILIEIEPRIQTPRKGRPDQFALPVLTNPYGRFPANSDIQEILETLIGARGIVDGAEWRLCRFGRSFYCTVRHQSPETAQRYAERILRHFV